MSHVITSVQQLCDARFAENISSLKPPTENTLPPRSDLDDGLRIGTGKAPIKSGESGGGWKKLTRLTELPFEGETRKLSDEADVPGQRQTFPSEDVATEAEEWAARVVACALQLVSPSFHVIAKR